MSDTKIVFLLPVTGTTSKISTNDMVRSPGSLKTFVKDIIWTTFFYFSIMQNFSIFRS